MKFEEVIQAIRDGKIVYCINKEDLELCRSDPELFSIDDYSYDFSLEEDYIDVNTTSLLSNNWYIKEDTK